MELNNWHKALLALCVLFAAVVGFSALFGGQAMAQESDDTQRYYINTTTPDGTQLAGNKFMLKIQNLDTGKTQKIGMNRNATSTYKYIDLHANDTYQMQVIYTHNYSNYNYRFKFTPSNYSVQSDDVASPLLDVQVENPNTDGLSVCAHPSKQTSGLNGSNTQEIRFANESGEVYADYNSNLYWVACNTDNPTELEHGIKSNADDLGVTLNLSETENYTVEVITTESDISYFNGPDGEGEFYAYSCTFDFTSEDFDPLYNKFTFAQNDCVHNWQWTTGGVTDSTNWLDYVYTYWWLWLLIIALLIAASEGR